MPLLSILITNYNTIDFLKLSLYAIKKLTKNDYVVLINDNGSNRHNIDELKKIESNGDAVINFRVSQQQTHSAAHGEALDILMSMVDTKYAAILDSDCLPLKKDWDEYLISKLSNPIKILLSVLTDIKLKLGYRKILSLLQTLSLM